MFQAAPVSLISVSKKPSKMKGYFHQHFQLYTLHVTEQLINHIIETWALMHRNSALLTVFSSASGALVISIWCSNALKY